MAVKAAFIGACGATLRHVLAWTLLDGHKAAARESKVTIPSVSKLIRHI